MKGQMADDVLLDHSVLPISTKHLNSGPVLSSRVLKKQGNPFYYL